jgi:hypothetical protein
MAASDAMPIPKRAIAYRYYFEFRKSDGTIITTVTGPDTEISKDGGSFTDCTNEFTEIGTSGPGYIDLSSGEMTGADSIIIKSTCTNTGALPHTAYLYPQEAGDVRVDVTTWLGTAPTVNTAGVPKVDVTMLNGDAQAAANHAIAASVMLIGTVDGTGTNSSTQIETTATSEATPNHFVGRAFFFSTSGVLNKQAAKITAYSYTGGRGRFTVEEMTEAPGSSDPFIII